MKLTHHIASDRGHADHGWLKTHHSFSFGQYYDPAKIHFGMLRVLNDDAVAPGEGFGMHPHDNMEIITIPLEGVLAHADSMGNQEELKTGEVQVMSAGSGLRHSEFNGSAEEWVKLLQIWIITAERNVPPRYDQRSFDPAVRQGNWQVLVHPKDAGDGLWIHQQAWISRIQTVPGQTFSYTLHKPENGVYFFNISGSANIADTMLQERDALGLEGTAEVAIEVLKPGDLLAIEVPMR